jgi:hypothetical protein
VNYHLITPGILSQSKKGGQNTLGFEEEEEFSMKSLERVSMSSKQQ